MNWTDMCVLKILVYCHQDSANEEAVAVGEHCASPKDVSEKEGVEKAKWCKRRSWKGVLRAAHNKHTEALVAYIVLAQDRDSK